MAETFAVEAKFDWKTNAPQVIETLTKGFRELLGLTEDLKKAFGSFDTGGLSKLTASLKELRTFAMPAAAIDSLKSAATSMNDIALSADKAAAAVVKMRTTLGDTQRPGGSGSSSGGGSGGGHGSFFGTATDLYFSGQMAGQAAGAVIRPAYDLGKARTQLLANNSPKQADAAIAASQDLQRSIRGTNVEGNVEVYRQLLALTQNPDEARALMPSFLPAGVALQTFNPDGGDYDHQLEAVTKNAEFKGMLSKLDPKTGKQVMDPTAASHMADMLLAMNVVSKGAIEPGTFLKFLRSGGTAAANMDLSEVPYLIPVIQALGPEKAGTGLKAMSMQFSAGRMSDAAVDMLQEMGLLSKDKKLYRKLGIGTWLLKPGAMNEKLFEEAVFHPKEFLDDTVIPSVQKYNHKNYGKKYDNATPEQKRAFDTATLQQLASRIPAGTFMGEILRNEFLSARDNAAYQKLDPATIKATMANSPQVAVESFTGSLNNLMGVLGGAPFKDAINVLNVFTGTLNLLSKAAQQHPDTAGTASTAAADAGIGAGLMGGGAALAKLFPKWAGKPIRLAGKSAGVLMMAIAFDEIAAGVLEGASSWVDKKVGWAATLDRKLGEAMRGIFGGSSTSPIQKQSFVGGDHEMRPIQINQTIHLDGREIGRHVETHLIRGMRPAVLHGSNNADYLAHPMAAGMRSI